MDTLNPNVRAMEYAVRGPIVVRAAEIEKELEKVNDLLCAEANSASYPQRDGERVVAHGLRGEGLVR